MKNLKNFISVLGVAILPFLSQVSVDSSGITFSSSDVSSVQTAVFNWAGSVFDMVIQFGPILIGVFVLFLVLRWIFNKF